MRDHALEKLQNSLVLSLKKNGNIVLAGGLTVSTKYGYMPLITKSFIDTIKPDVIVIMEVVPRRIQAYMEHEHVNWQHQRVERHMASIFCLRTGAPLKFIKVRSGDVKDALKETADIFRAAME
jgi:adenylate kinase